MNEREQRLRTLPGYIVLGKGERDNTYQGIIENSFSMGLSPDRACFFWTGIATSIIGKIEMDGRADAEHRQRHFAANHPGMTFEIFDVRAPELPVVIDWDEWVKAAVIGERQKFKARNPSFKMKE